MSSRVDIIGVGNPLLRDDGAGIRVLELLSQYDLPPHVRVIDAGVRGLDVYDVLTGDAGEIWIVDALRDQELPAGTVRDIDDLAAHLDEDALVWSGHDVGIAHALRLTAALDQHTPPVRLFGIVPESLDGGMELSPAVQHTAEQLARQLYDELWARCATEAIPTTREVI